ncbi:MAG: DnaJ family domain-containing protein [Phycisphaeraceae bacterium]
MNLFSERAIQLAADEKIRQAREAGDFDNLPGHGRPLRDLGEGPDPNWAVRRLIKRERLAGLTQTPAKPARNVT